LVRLRGGTAATNFSLAEYRLEMGDYHRMQSRLLRNDPLFLDITNNTVLYERWIKNGTEGFPEVDSPEMDATMEQIAGVFAAGGGIDGVGGGGDDPNAAAGAVVALAGTAAAAAAPARVGGTTPRTVTRATETTINRVQSNAERQAVAIAAVTAEADAAAAAVASYQQQQGDGDEDEEEPFAPEQELTQQKRQNPGHGPAMLALQQQIAGQTQPVQQQQQNGGDGGEPEQLQAMQQD
jgi:hypothetical protein